MADDAVGFEAEADAQQLALRKCMESLSHGHRELIHLRYSKSVRLADLKGGKTVDLRTEFALDTEPGGKTAVHVLSGEVIVAATDDEENVLKEISVKGNSAVELNPDTGGIDSITYDGEAFNNLQRESLIRSQPIKLQFDLGHRAGLYNGVRGVGML